MNVNNIYVSGTFKAEIPLHFKQIRYKKASLRKRNKPTEGYKTHFNNVVK